MSTTFTGNDGASVRKLGTNVQVTTIEGGVEQSPSAPSAAIWGQIVGNILQQADLQAQLGTKADEVALQTHIDDLNNPHEVTKAQVGLGNADNVSAADIAAQAVASIQATYPLAVSNGGTGAGAPNQALINLGGSTSGRAVFTGTQAQGRTALGSGANGDSLFTGATAAANRTILGASAIGSTIFTAADVPAVLQSLSIPAQPTFRNLLDNILFQITYSGEAATITTDNEFVVDRWRLSANGGRNNGVVSNVNPPPGFIRSLLSTIISAGAPAAGNFGGFRQVQDGQRAQSLLGGLANASPITVSVWVRSSVAGSYALSVRNNAGGRSYVAPITINSANTWEFKVITIPGDTGGAWPNIGTLNFYTEIAVHHTVGSTYQTATPNQWVTGNFIGFMGMTQLSATAAATFQLGPIQVEAANYASPIEQLSFSADLDRAELFYQKLVHANAEMVPGSLVTAGGNSWLLSLPYRHRMRAAPVPAIAGTFVINNTNGIQTVTGFTLGGQSTTGAIVTVTVSGSAVAQGQGAYYMQANSANARMWLDAQL